MLSQEMARLDIVPAIFREMSTSQSAPDQDDLFNENAIPPAAFND